MTYHYIITDICWQAYER